jgi:hypothetical protein
MSPKRPPLHRFTSNELLTLLISSLALSASFATLYLQFVYVSESVTAAKIHLEIPASVKSGPIELQIALINNGNRDTWVHGCSLESESLEFKLDTTADANAILKPNEIEPITLRGTVTINDNVINKDAPIVLGCSIVGSRGFDRKPALPIGTLIIRDGIVAGDDLLKFPIDLIK